MPAAHNAPGFQSFTDYLNANAGSLAQERAGALGSATAQGQQTQGEFEALKPQAYELGRSVAASQWGTEPFDQGNYKGMGEQNDRLAAARDFGAGADPTQLAGYSQLVGDLGKAQQTIGGLTGPQVLGKYGARESGMLGADVGYQNQAAALGKQYGGALNSYLNSLQGEAAAGGHMFEPTYKAAPTPTPEQPVEYPTGYAASGDSSNTPGGEPAKRREWDPNQQYDSQGNPVGAPAPWDPNKQDETQGQGGG